jgi:hypothetical protein
MATVMSGGDDWIGFPVNQLSTTPASRPAFSSPVNLYCQPLLLRDWAKLHGNELLEIAGS